MILNTPDAINKNLVPLIVGGKHVTIVTDNDAGRTDMGSYALALAAVGVPADAMTAANIDLIDPKDFRTWKLSVLVVAKAEAPPRFAAHVTRVYGGAARPDQDIIVLTRKPAELAPLLVAVLNGAFRPADHRMN